MHSGRLVGLVGWCLLFPFDLSWILLIGGSLLVLCSFPGPPAYHNSCRWVTMGPGQGGWFRSVVPLTPGGSLPPPCPSVDPHSVGSWDQSWLMAESPGGERNKTLTLRNWQTLTVWVAEALFHLCILTDHLLPFVAKQSLKESICNSPGTGTSLVAEWMKSHWAMKGEVFWPEGKGSGASVPSGKPGQVVHL